MPFIIYLTRTRQLVFNRGWNGVACDRFFTLIYKLRLTAWPFITILYINIYASWAGYGSIGWKYETHKGCNIGTILFVVCVSQWIILDIDRICSICSRSECFIDFTINCSRVYLLALAALASILGMSIVRWDFN